MEICSIPWVKFTELYFSLVLLLIKHQDMTALNFRDRRHKDPMCHRNRMMFHSCIDGATMFSRVVDIYLDIQGQKKVQNVFSAVMKTLNYSVLPTTTLTSRITPLSAECRSHFRDVLNDTDTRVKAYEWRRGWWNPWVLQGHTGTCFSLNSID